MADDTQAITRESILAEVGDSLQGQIEVNGRTEADRTITILRQLGYKCRVFYYATAGNTAFIAYTYGDPPSNDTGYTTWRDVDRECQRGFGGVWDFDTAAKRMGLDPAEMRRQKRRDLGY